MGVKDEIVRLEVPVDDPLRVELLDDGHDLRGHEDSFLDGQFL